MERGVIALVGAGQGGTAILKTLLEIPGVNIQYVYDVNPDAPGLKIAKTNKITCVTNDRFTEIAGNTQIDLIFEVTGKADVYAKLVSLKSPITNVIGAAGTRIIFYLLASEAQVARKLKEYQLSLERRIIERTEDLEQANRKLQNQILQYEELTRELEKVNEEKTRYLLQATHQLKAPFTAIQSYTDILLEGYTGEISGLSREILGKIKTRCELLSKAIKEMLELAQLKSLRFDSASLHETTLNEILSRVVENYAAIATKRKIRIDFHPCPKPDSIRGTPEQLVTLFSEFLENAIHYSDDGSTIEISADRPARDRMCVVVKDHGIGIPEENLKRVFDEYFRSNNAVRKHENGTGLGLAIARRIAQIHGFELNLESKLGAGTTVTVMIPVRELPGPPPDATRS
ncbi:MAG: ATP-binding protein [Pseudomonadota bacterium]